MDSMHPTQVRPTPWSCIPRGLALFLGGFALLNIAGDLMAPGFDANLWWIDLRRLPAPATTWFLLVSGILLIAFGLRPACSRLRRGATLVTSSLLCVAALANAAEYYFLRVGNAIHAGLAIPLSLLIVAALGLVMAACLQARSPQSPRAGLILTLAVCACCGVLFPLAQMFCFGKTDYRRPADLAVVLGAKAYANGRPSDALADRVRTACQLYHERLVSRLLFSGGPGEGAIHETESMKRMALWLGVKEEDILVDEAGLNTQATARNTETICSRLQVSRVLVVSHFYHLPRIKLAFQRDGWEIYTVPAKEPRLLRQLPYCIAREVAALWVYYFRPPERLT